MKNKFFKWVVNKFYNNLRPHLPIEVKPTYIYPSDMQLLKSEVIMVPEIVGSTIATEELLRKMWSGLVDNMEIEMINNEIDRTWKVTAYIYVMKPKK